MRTINISANEEQILKFCEDAPMMPDLSAEMREMYLQYGLGLLGLKQQQKLLNEQSVYNVKQLSLSRALVLATWALVIATLLLLKFA